MSIIICKYCGDRIDTDFNAEHEEECEMNQEIIQDQEFKWGEERETNE